MKNYIVDSLNRLYFLRQSCGGTKPRIHSDLFQIFSSRHSIQFIQLETYCEVYVFLVFNCTNTVIECVCARLFFSVVLNKLASNRRIMLQLRSTLMLKIVMVCSYCIKSRDYSSKQTTKRLVWLNRDSLGHFRH